MAFILLIRIVLGLDSEEFTGTPLVVAIMAVAALVWFAALIEINSHYGDKAAIYFLLGTVFTFLLRSGLRKAGRARKPL